MNMNELRSRRNLIDIIDYPTSCVINDTTNFSYYHQSVLVEIYVI